MTPQETIDALKLYVVNRIYDNEQFEVSGVDVQESILKTIDDLFSLIETSDSTQNLQQVLDISSDAIIATALDITANASQLLLGVDETNRIIASGGTSLIKSDGGSGYSSSISCNPNDILIEGLANGGSVGGRLLVGASRITIEGFNTNSNGRTGIYGAIGGGLSVSNKNTPNIYATATWDIDGDLKIREVPTATDDNVLTIDVDGNVRKKTLSIPTPIVINKTADFTTDTNFDGNTYYLDSGTITMTLEANVLPVGGKFTILAGSGTLATVINGVGITAFGKIDNTIGGRGAEVRRVNDDGGNQVYFLNKLVTSLDV